MARYLTEFLWAFFLVLVIALTGNPIAIWFVLMVMVYMWGAVSGGHYNPAVTLGVLLRKKIWTSDALIYMIVQVLGALWAVALAAWVFPSNVLLPAVGTNPVTTEVFSTYAALALEVVFTFALVSTVLHTAASKKTEWNSYFGLAIGMTVLVAAFTAGPVSWWAFNPAVGLGPYIYDLLTANSGAHYVWLLYVLGPILGWVLAAGYHGLTQSDD